jgi:two-component system, NtrC family, response regulator AtoC
MNSQPRILVIEDDRHVRSLLCDLLRAWGYAIDAAAGGREGLDRFDPGAHDVVLTDLAMPEVTGLDVVAGVRDRDPSVPIIMFTASMADLAAEGERLGFRVLHKPLDIEGLRRVVGESLAAAARPV